MKKLIFLFICIMNTSLNAGEPTTPRRAIKQLLLANIKADQLSEDQSDGAVTERAESPPFSHHSDDQLQDAIEYCQDLDVRLTKLEEKFSSPFISLKTPYSAGMAALLAHAWLWDEAIKQSSLSDKHKELLENVLQKSRENLQLNFAQTIIMQHRAHNGWHFIAWCTALDLLQSKITFDVKPVADYFGNHYSEETIKMGIKGVAAWCLASLAQGIVQTRHQH